MKKIGVTQRVDHIDSRNETRDGLDQKLCEFILQCGFYPIPIPNVFYTPPFLKQGKELLEGWIASVDLHGFVISGGNEANAITPRNKTELAICDYASQQDLPLLGICHGMHMLAIWTNTPLIKIDNHVAVCHEINEDSKQRMVNSYHNYTLAHKPEHFKIIATASDGTIERIQHEQLPWEGWMWHPEREPDFSILDMEQFTKLMS